MENKKLKRGQELELTISDIAFGGQGISKYNNLIFFVKDAIPNQKIIARISRVKKKYVEAFKVKILKESKDEIDPKCNHFKYCGGCTLQQLDYKKQIHYKEKQVHDILTKIGEIKNPKINLIISCDKIFYYRNKMEYTFSGNPWYVGNETYDDVIIGLHIPKRFDKILSIDECHINSPTFNELNKAIKICVNKYNIKPYDVKKHIGFLRFLVLRIGAHTNEIMVNLVTSGYKPELIRPIVNLIKNKFPNVRSIVNTINANKNNTATGNTKLIYGQSYIDEKIGEFKKNDIVYDLYCGTGTIGIYISSYIKKVFGVEIIEDAIEDAKLNAKKNNVKNAYYYASDIKEFFNESINDVEKPNTIIIDPPRPGLHPNVINNIISLLPPKIIYVSCNPSTQARDVKLFIENKYKVFDIQPIDMFPHTPHIECIITLKNKI